MSNLCRNGGGIFHGTCIKVQKAGSQCYWVGVSTTSEATMTVIENNTAHGENVLLSILNFSIAKAEITFCASFVSNLRDPSFIPLY
jgi:hypothetical protein